MAMELDRATIIAALTRLNELLREQGVLGELRLLGGTAMVLAFNARTKPPAWAWAEDRKLRTPWFASPGPAIRAMLLLESPAPFRERNLFVSENALSRA